MVHLVPCSEEKALILVSDMCAQETLRCALLFSFFEALCDEYMTSQTSYFSVLVLDTPE